MCQTLFNDIIVHVAISVFVLNDILNVISLRLSQEFIHTNH